jgi:hypothetical protein
MNEAKADEQFCPIHRFDGLDQRLSNSQVLKQKRVSQILHW